MARQLLVTYKVLAAALEEEELHILILEVWELLTKETTEVLVVQILEA